MRNILDEFEKQYEKNLNEEGPIWGRIDRKTGEWYRDENDYLEAIEYDIDWPDNPAVLAAEWETIT
jgi:hypothetical protein